ncbi:hypothetical protein [Flavobacterium psychrophilum]|nr:hypothetical protein [Flavobacterium psychrophilum]
MNKYKYTPKPLFYWLVASLIISFIISPPVFILVCGGWFTYTFIVFCNKL